MYSGKFDKFADNLNTYLSEFKKKIPSMIFGVVFDAGTVIDLFSKGNEGNKTDIKYFKFRLCLQFTYTILYLKHVRYHFFY